MISEKWWRSWLKVITWRLVAVVALGLVALAATGSLALTGAILGVDILIKSFLYYLHERIWNASNLGRIIEEKDGCVVWFTGLSGSGKTTLADEVARRLRKKGLAVKRIDGDVARATFSSDLGFSKEDRDENNKRAAYAASWGATDSIVLASFISPYKKQRDYTRSICENYIEIFVDCPLCICQERDPKGLYAKVKRGEIKSFTGVHKDAPYEAPRQGEYDLIINTFGHSVDKCAKKVMKMLKESGVI